MIGSVNNNQSMISLSEHFCSAIGTFGDLCMEGFKYNPYFGTKTLRLRCDVYFELGETTIFPFTNVIHLTYAIPYIPMEIGLM